MSSIKHIVEKIEEQRINISDRDLRFYQFDKIVRISKFLEKYKDCDQCKHFIDIISDFVNNMSENLKDRKQRIYLDKIIEKTIRHLRIDHGYYLEKYFNYHYSVFGMFIGLSVGVVFSFIDIGYAKAPLIISCLIIGLIIGRIIGNYKDIKVKKADRQM
ncbi:MAG: hypothetical protein ABIJ97_17105 [Bacteroidota bacterium]